MPPRTTKNSAGAAPENTEHAPMDVQLVPADAELDPANVESDTSDVELALTEQFSDNRLEQFMSLSEKRRRKEEERREEREAKRHEEREQRRREYEERREEREEKRREEREQRRREYEERREEREEIRREEREQRRREDEDRREERRQDEHWHLLEAIQALSVPTPASKPTTIAPVMVEEDSAADVETANDPHKTASTAQFVKSEPFRGTRGGANRTQKTSDGVSKQEAQGIHNSKAEARVWKYTPYLPGAEPVPKEPMVRLVFPALDAYDKIADSASFDTNKTTVAKVFGIPALSRITDPDLPKKLELAQDVFFRNTIPTSLWAFYLAAKMSGDFAPIAKKINFQTKWHICVWSVVTCLEGLEQYIRTREAFLRASQATPASNDFTAGIVELCARYKETPILMVSPSTRIEDLAMTVNTWGPVFGQEIFDQALQKSDYKLSTAGEYVLTLDTIEAVLRRDLTKQIKQVTTLVKSPQPQSSPATIVDSSLYQVQTDDADNADADDDEDDNDAIYVAQYQKNSGKCFNCGKKGHFASTCKQPKKSQYSQRPSRATGSFAQRGGNTTGNTTRRQQTRDGDKRPSVVAKSLASAKDGEFVRIEGRLYRKNTSRNQALVLEEGDEDGGDGDTEEFLEQEAEEFD
ncbi:hypothetical protein SEPCBS119000_006759, partial [Sporothrix epigloea]